VAGVLAELDGKDGGQIAGAGAGTDSPRVQALLTEVPRDGSAVGAQRAQQLRRAARAGGGP
jgi:hypothetical protein